MALRRRVIAQGPNGEKRPTDTVGCAVHVMKIAIGEIEEELPEIQQGKVNGGKARISIHDPGAERI